jgi:hypothetical protein
MRQAFRFMFAGVNAAAALIALIASTLSDAGTLSRSEPRYSLTSGAIPNGELPVQAPEQYVRDKLQLSAVHRMARGTNVPIAVIDSEIDESHPDLNGAVSLQYEPTGVKELPHAHGTGIAGAIVSHQTLMGVAPGAHIMGIRVFSGRDDDPKATARNILKGLDWAVNHNVRIVNMSFTGARDPLLDGALKGAYDKGVILIAAVGNEGPGAQPLFPAADPIALTSCASGSARWPPCSCARCTASALPVPDATCGTIRLKLLKRSSNRSKRAVKPPPRGLIRYHQVLGDCARDEAPPRTIALREYPGMNRTLQGGWRDVYIISEPSFRSRRA